MIKLLCFLISGHLALAGSAQVQVVLVGIRSVYAGITHAEFKDLAATPPLSETVFIKRRSDYVDTHTKVAVLHNNSGRPYHSPPFIGGIDLAQLVPFHSGRIDRSPSDSYDFYGNTLGRGLPVVDQFELPQIPASFDPGGMEAKISTELLFCCISCDFVGDFRVTKCAPCGS